MARGPAARETADELDLWKLGNGGVSRRTAFDIERVAVMAGNPGDLAAPNFSVIKVSSFAVAALFAENSSGCVDSPIFVGVEGREPGWRIPNVGDVDLETRLQQ